MLAAMVYGLSHIHLLEVPVEWTRLAIEAELIRTLDPPLNERQPDGIFQSPLRGIFQKR